MDSENALRHDLAAVILALTAAFLLFFPQMLFSGHVIHCRDAGRTVYPFKLYMTERLRMGELPLWFPYDALGTPFIANTTTAVFHPATLFHLVLDPASGLVATALAALAAGFCGAFALARLMSMPRWASALAGIGFSFSGPMLSSMDQVPFLIGITGFSVFMAGVYELTRGRRPRLGFLIATLALASTTLDGDFQAAYFYGISSVPIILSAPRARIFRSFILVGGVGFLGLGAAGVQLAPSLEIVPYLERSRGLAWEEASMWSLHPLRLADLFVGDITQTGPVSRTDQALNLLGHRGYVPWLLGASLGPGYLLLCMFAVALAPPERRGRVRLVAAAAVTLLLIGMGRFGGLYRVMFELVPGWASFRYPEKIVPYAGLPLGLLAAHGAVFAAQGGRRPFEVGAVLGALYLAAGVACVAAPEAVRAMVLSIASPSPAVASSAPAAAATFVARLGPGLLMGTAWISLFLLLALLGQRGRSVAGPATVAAMMLQLMSLNSAAQSRCLGPRAGLNVPAALVSVLDRVAGPRPGTYRTASAFSEPGMLGLTGDDATFLSKHNWNRQALLPLTGAIDRVESSNCYMPALFDRYVDLSGNHEENWARRWAPLYNGQYLVTDPKLIQTLPTAIVEEVVRSAQTHMILARRRDALPRAFLARPRWETSRELALRALSTPSVQRGEEVVIEGRPTAALEKTETSTLGLGRARVVRYLPERVEVAVDSTQPAFLVLNDLNYPGWKASIDGVDTPIFQANYLVRGVEVPAGRHLAVFTFPLPESIRLGAVVSFFSLAVLGLLLRYAGPRIFAGALSSPRSS
ncbi:MAG: hypothetical protein HYV07_02100 [Deltaproteobacteria bacterium]|nr:hypothetical protein [Deltaproteobacteria bacterium]